METKNESCFGKLIGYGTERTCYENPHNPDTCFKVSRREHAKQTLREIKYFNFLKKKKISASFLPKYYGSYITKEYVILEQEYLHPNDEYSTILLREYITQATEQELFELDEILDEVKEEMIKKNIIVSDLRTGNTLLFITPSHLIHRLVFLDGFGSPEFIPLPIYCPYFGKKKIQRQWTKFMKKYKEERKVRYNQLIDMAQ